MARDHMGRGVQASLVWSDDPSRDRLVGMYEDAKAAQWDAAADLDWSVDVDPGALAASGPDGLAGAGPDAGVAVDWATLDDPLTAALGRDPAVVHDLVAHQHAWLVSQLLHAEQGALVAMAKVCAALDSVEAKLCAALQMTDEARHVEAYRLYLDKIGLRHDASPAVRDLLGEAVAHRSLDLTFLGVQILVENLALAVATLAVRVFGNPLIGEIVRRIRADEDRHVDFGVAAFDGLRAAMDPVDRREREDFVLDACALLRTRFHPTEVWEHFGLDPATAAGCYADSPDAAAVHALAFARIVPDLHRLGLLTPRVRHGFEAMGVLRFGPLPAPPDEDAPAPGERSGAPGAGTWGAGPGGQGESGGPGDPGPAGLVGEAVTTAGGLEVHPAGLAGVDVADPLLALRAALGCVEQIPPEPVLRAMGGLITRVRLGSVPAARIRLEVSGHEGGAWLLTVGEGGLAHRRADGGGAGDGGGAEQTGEVADAGGAEVTIRMDGATWTDLVAGRSTMPAALAGGRIAVTGDVFKARALEALL